MTRKKASARRRSPTSAQVDHLPHTTLHLAPTRVYVAVPKAGFGSREHTRALARVERRFPGAEIIDAATAFTSWEDWLRRWPKLVLALQHVVFVSYPDRIIGAGVFREILDATFHRVPVEYLTPSGSFVDLHRVSLRMLADGDAARFAVISLSGRS